MTDVKSGCGRVASFEYVAPDTRVEKFTPGPWSVFDDITRDRDMNGHYSGDEYIAGFNIESEGWEVVSCEGISGSGEVERANANLIAAAPDLYHALDVLVAILELDTRGYVFDAVCSARAALSKARGES